MKNEKKEEKIPLLLLSAETMMKLGRRLRFLGRILSPLNRGLSSALIKIGMEIEPESYMVGSLVSSLFYGILFFAMAFVALTIRAEASDPAGPALAVGVAFWAIFFLLHMIYPNIIVKKISAKENKDLLYALREIMIDVDGGIPLFEAIKNASTGDYGYVTKDFERVIRQIENGIPEKDALRELAIKTDSEYLKRALWQMVNAMESGAKMSDALFGIVHAIEEYTYRDIKSYSSNLNFLILIYMLCAAVLPSLGITMLVILSAFSGLGVTVETILGLVGLSAFLQIIMIGYMSSTRPEIFGG